MALPDERAGSTGVGAGNPRRHVEVEATGIDHNGDALARDARGGRYVVPRLLPGETAVVKVHRRVRGKSWSSPVEVLSASSMRVEAPCPAYLEGCGGCQLQHVRLADQRRLKRDRVIDHLRHRLGVDAVGEVPTIELDPWAFRTTLRLAVDREGVAGFRKRRTHHVVGGHGCLVAHPLLDALIRECRFPGAEEVTLRCGDRTGERLATGFPTLEGATLPSDVRRDAFEELAAERRWRVSARSFFQSRPDAVDALAALVRDAAEEIDGPQTALDLYCGVGIFAGSLADLGWRVTAVESDASAVADARWNTRGDEVTVVEADVTAWDPPRASLVVADPNRIGLGKAGAEVIARARARRIVLISCDVTGLGNDLDALCGLGFGITRMSLLDVFPHTLHIEAVTVLDRLG
jgi:23S rRNA (uracil1939-C5)-methyltransferase